MLKATRHIFYNKNSTDLSEIRDKSVNLIVTSPPYPMIEMWNECFTSQDKRIDLCDYDNAYSKMHELLDKVWRECDRVLADNGFICINIGDAVKNCNGNFKVYSNHARILEFFERKNYSVLPSILWVKPSNSPNKFMGSGMLPAGAYVTQEHEFILIFRKGGKRDFKNEEDKELRRKSAYFWEERNVWFSDVWKINGTRQKIQNIDRKRSGAFPFEIPYRLINMYSVKGDTVLDVFMGTGTTAIAALASERNSVGYDISENLEKVFSENLLSSKIFINEYIENRISNHKNFINSLDKEKNDRCYLNEYHNFKVKTTQEQFLQINKIDKILCDEKMIKCSYKKENLL